MKNLTLLDKVRRGWMPPEVKEVAKRESITPEELARKVLEGKVVITRHQKRFLGIGSGLRTKVNVNLGTSPVNNNLSLELEKLKRVCLAGTDTVMDLSTGGNLDLIREQILRKSLVPVGTVPIYQAAVLAVSRHQAISRMKPEDIFDTIEKQARQGVSFITVHSGVTSRVVERLKRYPRVMSVVSRGGAFTICWMVANQKENPLYEQFDRLLEIARKYDLVLSLGDGFRPGGLSDATDHCQIEELMTLGELTKRAREAGVQVMIEGPGHIPLPEIAANVLLAKKLCEGAPFYVLGPLVTDVAPGYDHITAAIGAAIAGWHGADFICAVSPTEHLSLPDVEDVVNGLMAARLAAHAADLAKGNQNAWKWNQEMERARFRRQWKQQKRISLNPEKFEKLLKKGIFPPDNTCSMCGQYCAMKLMDTSLR
ncbi:MAG: phosphomethylpyrimidine synthase ThiC [Candidatus Omnitrophica bacterium]|nr:phosphomethylpyrimidine synthase ThiC [Candidatus Omnitrophota bacterium]